MKKVMAMVLTVAMLLALMVIVPAAEEIKIPLVNGDLKQGDIGATTIVDAETAVPGWEGTSTSAGWELKEDGGGRHLAGNDAASFKQTVELTDDIVAAFSDWNWILKTKVVYCTYATITLYNADKTESVSTDFNTFDNRAAAVHEDKIDVTAALKAMENPKYLEIAFTGHRNGCQYYNIELYADIPADAGVNVLVNSDFSNGIEGWGTEGETVKVIWKEGNEDAYINLTPAIGPEGYVSGAGQLVQDYTDFKAGDVYKLVVKYQALTDSSAWVRIDNSGWIAQVSQMLPKTGDSFDEANWETYELYYKVPASLDKLRVYLRMHPWNGPDEGCWFDEVKLIKMEAAADNYIMNGGFEYDANGSTSIIGWENTGTSDYKAWTTKGDPSGEPYCPPTEENGKNVAYVMGSGSTLKQTVTIDSADEAFINFECYKWNLQFDCYSGVRSGSNPSVKITVADAVGNTATKTWDVATELGWNELIAAKMYRNTISLASLQEELGTPVKTITVELGTSIEAAWDGIKLYPVYEEPAPAYNFAVNPSFEEGVEEEYEGMTIFTPDAWTFEGTSAMECVGTDGGSDGDVYIALLDGTRAQLSLTGEQLPAANAYKLEFDYKQLGTDGFIKIEDRLTGATILEGSMGQATGTTEDDMEWKTYTNYFFLGEGVDGIRLMLRNGADENLCYYDNVKINAVEGYDPSNLVVNGDFEMAAVVGATTFLGWHNVNTNCLATVGFRDGSTVAEMPGSTSQLRQTVAIKDHKGVEGDEVRNYNYTFSVDMCYHSGGFPAFMLTTIHENGNKMEQRVDIVRSADAVTDPKSQIFANLWQWNTLTYDLSWMIEENNFSPLVGIQIDLMSGGGGCAYDNVKIISDKPEDPNTIKVTDASGAAVKKITTAAGTSFTATVTSAQESDSILFFALYGTEEDADIITSLGMVTVPAGETKDVTLSDVSVVAGRHTVKAIMLDKATLSTVSSAVIK